MRGLSKLPCKCQFPYLTARKTSQPQRLRDLCLEKIDMRRNPSSTYFIVSNCRSTCYPPLSFSPFLFIINRLSRVLTLRTATLGWRTAKPKLPSVKCTCRKGRGSRSRHSLSLNRTETPRRANKFATPDHARRPTRYVPCFLASFPHGADRGEPVSAEGRTPGQVLYHPRGAQVTPS